MYIQQRERDSEALSPSASLAREGEGRGGRQRQLQLRPLSSHRSTYLAAATAGCVPLFSETPSPAARAFARQTIERKRGGDKLDLAQVSLAQQQRGLRPRHLPYVSNLSD